LNLFLQLTANGLANAALYAMLAVGFGLMCRSFKVFHLAFGGLFVVSGYVFHSLAVSGGLSPWLSGALTILISAGLGWLLDIGVSRPFVRKPAGSGPVLIASLGVLIVIQNAVAMIFGSELQSVPRGLSKSISMGPVRLTSVQLTGLILGVLSVTGLLTLVLRLRTFKALWAMGDEPDLVPVLGLPLFRLRSIALAISAGMAAIPACLITYDIGIEPCSGMSYLLIAALAVLAGGANKYLGWVLGAVILAMLQSWVVWGLSARWMDLATFSMLVAMLVFRPGGLLSDRQRVEES
jgi:branched-subunit amino acid ABC-type transport system permease component